VYKRCKNIMFNPGHFWVWLLGHR